MAGGELRLGTMSMYMATDYATQKTFCQYHVNTSRFINMGTESTT